MALASQKMCSRANLWKKQKIGVGHVKNWKNGSSHLHSLIFSFVVIGVTNNNLSLNFIFCRYHSMSLKGFMIFVSLIMSIFYFWTSSDTSRCLSFWHLKHHWQFTYLMFSVIIFSLIVNNEFTPMSQHV